MGWDRTAGTDPKYRTPEHRREVARLKALLRRHGTLECTAPVCLMPTRDITNPDGRDPDGLHAGHNDDGVTYAGPQHGRCNVTEAAVRARAKQGDKKPSMRLTPGLVRP